MPAIDSNITNLGNNNQNLQSTLPIQEINNFDKIITKFPNNQKHRKSKSIKKRSSKSGTLTNEKTNTFNSYENTLSCIIFRNLKLQEKINIEMYENIFLSFKNNNETISFYKKISKKIIQEYDTIIFHFKFLKNKNLEEKNLNIWLIDNLTNKINNFKNEIEFLNNIKAITSCDLLKIRNLIFNTINYLSKTFYN